MAVPDPERLEMVLTAVSAGEPVRRALRDCHLGTHEFYAHVHGDEKFAERYYKAKIDGMDGLADEAMRIADDPTIEPNDKRIRVDTRKWLLSKMAPQKYGDKVSMTGVDGQGPVELIVTWRNSALKPPE